MKTALIAIGGFLALIVIILGGMVAAGALSIFGANVNAIVAKQTLNPGVTVAVFNPQNKLQSQAYFENTYADFTGFLAQIRIVKASVSPTKQQDLEGLRLECVSTAQAYNAASRSISTAPFLSVDLPYRLNSARCAV
jgi:hypothetical protein